MKYYFMGSCVDRSREGTNACGHEGIGYEFSRNFARFVPPITVCCSTSMCSKRQQGRLSGRSVGERSRYIHLQV